MRDTRLADWRTYTCRWCAEKFHRAARTGRKPEFCSDNCRMAFWAKVRWTEQNAFRAGRGIDIAQSNETPGKTQASSSISTGTFRGRGIDLAGVEPAVRERILDLTFPGWTWAHPHEDGGAE
jgi:hypothetical protein